MLEGPCGSSGRESAYNAGDLGLIPGLGRSPGEGDLTPVGIHWVPTVSSLLRHGDWSLEHDAGQCWNFSSCDMLGLYLQMEVPDRERKGMTRNKAIHSRIPWTV